MVRRRLLAIPAIVMAAVFVSAASGEDPIVVEGSREASVVSAGEWEVQISRSYRFGKSLDGKNDVRALGKERTFNFCLRDTQIELFVRQLVGEGPSDVASSTSCRPMHMKIENGHVHASQVCNGGSVSVVADEETKRTSTQPTKLSLNVDGSFDAASLKIDFESRRELLTRDGLDALRPDLMRWSIVGRKMGAC